MDLMYFLVFALGFFIGSLIVYLISFQLRNSFSHDSDIAFKKFQDFASEKLNDKIEKVDNRFEDKKKLIDNNLDKVNKSLNELMTQSTLLRNKLEDSQKETINLRETTVDLKNILSNSQSRGQWGERMAKDILNMMGLIENINYTYQDPVISGEKPDFTFNLPKEKKLNMDVKFPLTHYEKFISSKTDFEKEIEKKAFLNDVKNHVNSVGKKGYINSDTVDYVLLFIPNESIYSFILENEKTVNILEIAFSKRIVLCSPITLYAVLSLISQAIKSFSAEKNALKLQLMVEEFYKQWSLYSESMNKMGRALNSAKTEYEALSGARTNKLDASLEQIKTINLINNEEN